MYWREVNAYSENVDAEIHLYESVTIAGEEREIIHCRLFKFEPVETIYEMENGGAFKKNEVKAWPFVLLADLDVYNNKQQAEEIRQSKVHSVPHEKVKSIVLKDRKGNVLVDKRKI